MRPAGGVTGRGRGCPCRAPDVCVNAWPKREAAGRIAHGLPNASRKSVDVGGLEWTPVKTWNQSNLWFTNDIASEVMRRQLVAETRRFESTPAASTK